MFADIHNHILPGVDDGAPSMGHSVEMARQAVAGGTDLLAATPHRKYYTRKSAANDWLRERVQQVNKMLKIEHIPLTVVPGLEIPLTSAVAGELLRGELMTLGDAGISVLIEPPFEGLPEDAVASLQAIRDAGFEVVLAHPERNGDIQHDLTFLDLCAPMEITLQLTSGSLLGMFGMAAQATAYAILQRWRDWPIIIASDGHDLRERTVTRMRDARDAAAAVVGYDEADEMVDLRPRALLGL